ncbi:MAG: hypothetical protein IT288_01715 [Bdellovibrionales bacterium]|nr:hypothetical protein [Bdellovibrionales bacterium]
MVTVVALNDDDPLSIHLVEVIQKMRHPDAKIPMRKCADSAKRIEPTPIEPQIKGCYKALP